MPQPRRRSSRRLWLAATLVVFSGALLGYATFLRRDPIPDFSSLEITDDNGIVGEPAISPDEKTILYVVGEGDSQDIWMFDRASRVRQPWTTTAGADRAPVWSRDGMIYFESERNGKRGIYKAGRLGGNEARLVVPEGREPAVSPDGRMLAFTMVPVGSSHTRIGIVPLPGSAPVHTLTTDADGLWSHDGPAWSPDSREVCYWAYDGLWTIRVPNGPARRLTPGNGTDQHPAWASDGRHIYFSSRRGSDLYQLWRIQVKGGTPELVNATSTAAPETSSGGGMIVFSEPRQRRELEVYDIATGARGRVQGVAPAFPAFGPGARSLFFLSAEQGRQEIYRQPLRDGLPDSRTERVTEQEGLATQPACSPDGRYLAYVEIMGPERKLWIAHAEDGSHPVRIAAPEGSDHCYHPAWSPDSSRLAYAAARKGDSESERIWLQQIADGKPTGPPVRLTNGNVAERAPAWSRDGVWVAFVTGRGSESGEVAIASPDKPGTGLQDLTSGAGACFVRWLPDSRELLVSGTWGGSRREIRTLDRLTRIHLALSPPVTLDADDWAVNFDVSDDGHRLALLRVETRSRIRVLEASKGQRF